MNKILFKDIIFFSNVVNFINTFFYVYDSLLVYKFLTSQKLYSSFFSLSQLKLELLIFWTNSLLNSVVQCRKSNIAKIDNNHLKHDIYFNTDCLDLFLELTVFKNIFYKFLKIVQLTYLIM